MNNNKKLESVYEKLHHEYKNKDGSKHVKVVYPYTESKVVLLTKDPNGRSLEDFLKEQKKINESAIQSIVIDENEPFDPQTILSLKSGNGIVIEEIDGSVHISSNLKIDEIVNDNPNKYALKIVNSGKGGIDIVNSSGNGININNTSSSTAINIDSSGNGLSIKTDEAYSTGLSILSGEYATALSISGDETATGISISGISTGLDITSSGDEAALSISKSDGTGISISGDGRYGISMEKESGTGLYIDSFSSEPAVKIIADGTGKGVLINNEAFNSALEISNDDGTILKIPQNSTGNIIIYRNYYAGGTYFTIGADGHTNIIYRNNLSNNKTFNSVLINKEYQNDDTTFLSYCNYADSTRMLSATLSGTRSTEPIYIYDYGTNPSSQSSYAYVKPTIFIEASGYKKGGIKVKADNWYASTNGGYCFGAELIAGTAIDINSLIARNGSNIGTNKKIGIVIRDNNTASQSNGYVHGIVLNSKFEKSAISITADDDSYLLNNGYLDTTSSFPSMPIGIEINSSYITDSYIKIKNHGSKSSSYSKATDISIDNSNDPQYSNPAIDILNGKRLYGVKVTQGRLSAGGSDISATGFYYTSLSSSEGYGGTALMVRGSAGAAVDMASDSISAPNGFAFRYENTNPNNIIHGMYLSGVNNGIEIRHRENVYSASRSIYIYANKSASNHTGIYMVGAGKGIYINHDTSRVDGKISSFEIASSINDGASKLTGIKMGYHLYRAMEITLGSGNYGHSDIFYISSVNTNSSGAYLMNATVKTNGIKYYNSNTSNSATGLDISYVRTGINITHGDMPFGGYGVSILSNYSANSSKLTGIYMNGYMEKALDITMSQMSGSGYGIYLNSYSDNTSFLTGVSLYGYMKSFIGITLPQSQNATIIDITSQGNDNSTGIKLTNIGKPISITMDIGKDKGDAIYMSSYNGSSSYSGIKIDSFYNPIYIHMDTSRNHGNGIKMESANTSTGSYFIDMTGPCGFIKMTDTNANYYGGRSYIDLNTVNTSRIALNINSVSTAINITNDCGNAININDTSSENHGINIHLNKGTTSYYGLNISNEDCSSRSMSVEGFSYLNKIITDDIYFSSSSEANNIKHYTEANSSSFTNPEDTNFSVNAHMFKFDLSKEVTITGTISSLNYNTSNTNLIIGVINVNAYKPLYDVNGICKGITNAGDIELIPYTLNTSGELLIMKLTDSNSTLDSVDFTIKYRGL